VGRGGMGGGYLIFRMKESFRRFKQKIKNKNKKNKIENDKGERKKKKKKGWESKATEVDPTPKYMKAKQSRIKLDSENQKRGEER